MIVARRGKNIAIIGAVCQLALVGTMLAVWLVTNSLSALAALLMIAGGVCLWLVTAMLFYCRQLARREAMEFEELAADGRASSTIFESAVEGELRPAVARLARMELWVPPIFALLWCAYNAGLGVLVLRHLLRVDPPALEKAGIGLLFSFLAGFACFLFSRYCTGMSTQAAWRLLRASGSFLLVNVLFVGGVMVALAVGNSWPRLDFVIAVVVAAAQLVLAVELLANLITGFYRPRIPGREERFSFDSRLCNVLAEPQRMGRSIAETLNYQFGFEVSKTWFYKLVSKAFLPLIAFGVLILFLMSSIVIVRSGEKAVVLHWGRPDENRSTLEPGMHLKWPWPVDTARRFSMTEVHEVWLGLRERTAKEKAGAKEKIVNGHRLELWADPHVHKDKAETDFVLASSRERSEVKKKPPPQVSVIKLVAVVQYVITDPYKYGYRFVDPHKMIECMAYREMVRYCASATLDSPAGEGRADRPEAIMTYGRQRAADELKRRIQQAVADEPFALGVKIIYVGLRAVHPPSDAAEAFEGVIAARHQVNRMRYEAEAEADRGLTEAAGSPRKALELALAIRKMEQLEDLRRLEARPDQMRRELKGFIGKARDDIETLDNEIEAERLLGKTAGYRHDLRQKHQQHLQLLLAIEEGPDAGKRKGAIDLAAEGAKAHKEAAARFEQATGRPEALVAAARARRWQLELAELSRLDSFEKELPAFEASPGIYMLDRWLDAWDKVLPNISKLVIGVDPRMVEYRANLERRYDPTAGTYEPTESAEKE